MSDSEYRKEHRRIKREQGLCCFCIRPVQEFRSMCSYHLEKQNLKAIRRKIRRLNANMCVACNKNPIVQGKTKCVNCVEIDKNRYKASSVEVRERVRVNAQSRYMALKVQVYAAYGNECSCCQIKEESFFTLDHVNNDGRTHRDELGTKGGLLMLLWVVDNDFPDTIQLLCANCHLSKTRLGVCVHKVPISGS